MGRRKAKAPEPVTSTEQAPEPVVAPAEEKSVPPTETPMASSFIISETDASAFVSTLGISPDAAPAADKSRSTVELATAGEALLRSAAPPKGVKQKGPIDAHALPAWLVDEPVGMAIREDTPVPQAPEQKRRGRPPKSITFLPPEELSMPRAAAIVPVGRTDVATTINKIIFELNTFAPLLEPFHKGDPNGFTDSLYKRSGQELDALLSVMVKHRMVANLSNQLKHLLFMGANFIEMGTKAVGMATDGYSQALRQQENEIAMILKELALEKADQWAGAQRPEIRLGMLLSSTLLAVDTANRVKNLSSAATADKQAKYQDL